VGGISPGYRSGRPETHRSSTEKAEGPTNSRGS
jgi:hypothetical protein